MQKSLFDKKPRRSAQRKLTQPIKWHGGKRYLADWLISLMPPHLTYVEPFFGGGSVLLTRDPSRNWLEGHPIWNGSSAQQGCSEVANDMNGDLFNFWRVLQSEQRFAKFRRIVEAIPFAGPEFDSAMKGERGTDSVSRAVDFFVIARQSMSGRLNCFAPFTRNRTRGRRNEQANAWWNCIEGLQAVHQRLQGIAFYNDPAVDVIRRLDGPVTLFYLDPPYVHTTRATTGEYGNFEMDENAHRELLEALVDLRGKFLLSGYHCQLYDEWAAQHGWTCHERKIDNKASPAKSKEVKIECAWCN